MMENSMISEEYKNRVGEEWEVGVYDIEKGMIRQFVQAVADPNPRWQNEAPPGFILTVGGEQFGQLLGKVFPAGLLHGSTELECYQPVRAGDKIKVTVKLADIRERLSARTAFVTFDITYINQGGEMVARCRQKMVGYDSGGQA